MFAKQWAILIVAALIFGLVTARCSFGQTNSDNKPRKYALLIAVAKYNHAEMNKPQLRFPEADARELGKDLEASGYTVELLLGRDATQKAIRQKLDGLSNQGNAEGVAVVGLFGHGVEYEIQVDKGRRAPDAGFCPFDTSVREIKDSLGRKVFGCAGNHSASRAP